MDEYIDRANLIARIEYYVTHTPEGNGEHYAYSVVLNEVLNLPDADVAPVVHGRWVTHYRSGTPVAEGYVSTCCDIWKKRKSPYCPHCGAKMDGGDGDAAD